MWKNQGSWNFFHTKLIPNSSIIFLELKLNFMYLKRIFCQIGQVLAQLAYYVRRQSFEDSANFLVSLLSVIVVIIKLCLGIPPGVDDLIALVQGIPQILTYLKQLYCDFKNYCCPIKPLYTAISSLNPAEIGMISSYFKFQAPLE